MAADAVSSVPEHVPSVVHHRRRIRRPSHARVRRLTSVPYVVLGIGAALLIGITGFTLGTLVIGSFSQTPPQASAYGVPSAPVGVSFVSAEANLVTATSTPATGACTSSNLGSSGSPTPMTDGATTAICLSTSGGGFSASDEMFDLTISWSSSALTSTTFKVDISISVQPSANNLLATAYVQTSATIATGDSAVFAVDLTQSSDTQVTSFAALVTQM